MKNLRNRIVGTLLLLILILTAVGCTPAREELLKEGIYTNEIGISLVLRKDQVEINEPSEVPASVSGEELKELEVIPPEVYKNPKIAMANGKKYIDADGLDKQLELRENGNLIYKVTGSEYQYTKELPK